MLESVSKEIEDCYRHAQSCASRAKDENDPRLRQDFVNLARRWVRPARSYEFAERLEISQSPSRRPVK
jgi:hypothetical protein